MEVGVERGSAGCLSFAALPRSNFLLFQNVQKEAVLTEIQNRLDPTLTLPRARGRE
jgi:hypothetical protein